ncbi:protein-export membrane protein SecD [Emticicia oligotrophica DSM 17448]|uniref:Multifunctional fusion protein n=1 Tax=Emticicia oligotrophica (strain DSM 17448 / CIP 109782 / MTCC 6937 / GPTSA100-15) TaxID=929562 RepID=A0ABM5N137_EMTOG|nr:protein translocase subunit SecDF [Emticicia oligotrophica]AFK03106.1 protein-export membrane protein SecD [Emticicia oligotrophica DSM 17448]
MRNKGGIVALLVAFLAISVYFLARTWKANDIRKDAEAYATDKSGKVDYTKKQRYLDSLWKQPVFLGMTTTEDLMKQELGLGLDLQGGMSVILEVSPTEIVRALANSRDPKVATAISKAQERAANSSANFVDLFAEEFKKVAPDTKLSSIFSNSSNRGTLSLESSDSQVISYIKKEVDGAFDRAFRIIQTRVDKFGVANPNLQRLSGTNRIQVELPGVDNPQRVRKLLSGAAKLEFCEVYSMQEIAPAFDGLSAILLQMDAEAKAAAKTDLNKIAGKGDNAAAATNDTSKNSLAAKLAGGSKTDTSKKDSTALAQRQSNAFSNLFVGTGYGVAVRVKDTSRVNQIMRRPDVQSLFPADANFVYDVKPRANGTNANEDIVDIYFVKDLGKAPLEGDVVTNATQDFDERGKPAVEMQMNAEGARKWKALTAANVGRQVAIILDNFVYSAPVVNGEIGGGRSSISGNFTVEEALDLANVLKAGKLPAPTNVISEDIVGATVGSEAARAGILSSIIGVLFVLAFVMIYYNKAGLIANIALIVNLFLLLGVMASFGATLTLPGIAGLVLSVGMSVDANVLIYERIKEELALGKTFATAVRDGFQNAMSSIIDSNVTTLITGAVLFIFGSGLILGFATTLLIGIFTSLFSAIFVSRLLFEYYIGKGKTVSFYTKFTEKLFKDSQFDFVSKRKLYYTISSAIIIAGIVSIFFKGFGLGVDFLGGRTYVAKFEKTVNTEEIDAALKGTFEGQAIEVKTFGGFDQVKITTPYKIENTNPEIEKQIENNVNNALANVNGNKGKITSSSKVGPTIANDAIGGALKAILLSIALVFIYIYLRFRSLAFGYGALVALFHDVAIILGIFSIFRGWLPFSLDVDQAFVGAVLTIMGYSMNDTVVVFDRVREYLREKRGVREDIPTVINNALNSTLSRTAVTGFSTLIVLLVLLIFGGETIRGFVFAMFVGVIVGTYSSLFVATPIVVDAMQRDLKNEDAKLAAVPVDAEAKKGKKA